MFPEGLELEEVIYICSDVKKLIRTELYEVRVNMFFRIYSEP
jgi:hypothetical protein